MIDIKIYIKYLVTLIRLRISKVANARILARCIYYAVNEKKPYNKHTYLERIENIRSEMNESKKKIHSVDYGAGSPDEKRSLEQMETGVDNSRTLSDLSRLVSKPPKWYLLFYHLIRELKPNSLIEMGTAFGMSAMYMATALEINGQGNLVTLEGAIAHADIANSNFKELQLNRVELVTGRFDDTLIEVLNRKKPIDFIFVDGHHDGDATLEYFRIILPNLSKQSLIIFDDIDWSEGMQKAWKTIISEPNIDLSLKIGNIGFCLLSNADMRSKNMEMPSKYLDEY